ncbi:MAG: GlxA family transcriptional regulator [Steroidobacteraceae bacterium]
MKEIFFVLLPHAILLDVAGPAEAFRSASRRVPGSYRLRFASPMHTVETASGLKLAELEPLPKAVPDDALIVIPGVSGPLDFQDRANLRLIEWLSGGMVARAQLMCVGAGGLMAAKAGVLAGRECTTHPEHTEELRRIEPRARLHDNRIFVADGPMLTSAGVAAGIDLALYVIGQELGSRIAVEVARDLVVYLRRSGTDPVLSPWLMHRNHVHPALHRVQDAVIRNPTAPWSASRLAEVACTSPRNLARLFAEHAKCSPLDYVQLIRFSFARELVTQSQLDFEQVAFKAGFHSARQLRRVWARWESRPPSALRGGWV